VSAGHYQHVEIHELTEVWFTAGRYYGFDQNQFAVCRQRAVEFFRIAMDFSPAISMARRLC